MNNDILKPILAQVARDGLRTIGTALMSYGVIKDGAGLNAFIGAGMTIAGILWGWWTTSGQLQVEALLKKMTATSTPANAIIAAQVLPPAAAVDTKEKAISVKSVTNIIIAAIALSALFLTSSSAIAQVKLKTPQEVGADIK